MITAIQFPDELVDKVVENTLEYSPVLVLESDGIRQLTNSGAKIDKIAYTLTPSKRAISVDT